MELDRDAVGYRELSGAVVPRPIAWVSTRSTDGTPNLAPYSFFTVGATDPPTLAFSPNKSRGRKDTATNVVETGEFVVNIVTADLAEAMNETSATLHADEDEFDIDPSGEPGRSEHEGVTPADAVAVDAPRVAESPVNFECRRRDVVDLGGSDLVLGEVVHAHVDDDVTTDGKLDTSKLDVLGRLAGSEYCYTRDRFEMERPD